MICSSRREITCCWWHSQWWADVR